MTEYPERPTPGPEQPPEETPEWRTWPSAPAASATAPQPAYPPPIYPPAYPPAPGYYQPGYGQPGVYPPPAAYPPPPEYYQQGGQRPAAQPYPPQYPPYPQHPGYPPGYPPGYAPGYPPQGYAPYPPYPQQPQYPPYSPYSQAPGYAPGMAAPQSAAPAREPSLALGVLWTLLSGIVSFVVYAMLLGWQFGLGMIALLLVHEMGHFVVIRAKGLPAGLPIFIPLVGAFVTMRRSPQGVRDEAEIALAGPLAGTVGGVICLIAYWQTGLPVLLPLAYFSFYLNLLNLIPVGPLDGARITAAISKWIWPLGLLGVALGAWYTHDVLLIVLGVVGAFQLFSRFGEAGRSDYYAISVGARIYVTLLYFGLAAVLAYATFTLQPLMAATGRFF